MKFLKESNLSELYDGIESDDLNTKIWKTLEVGRRYDLPKNDCSIAVLDKNYEYGENSISQPNSEEVKLVVFEHPIFRNDGKMVDYTEENTATYDKESFIGLFLNMSSDEELREIFNIDGRLDESRNPLKDMADKHKKKQKGLSPFGNFNRDAGNVEDGIKFFNHVNNSDSGCESTGECLGENIDTTKLEESADNMDDMNKLEQELRTKLSNNRIQHSENMYDDNNNEIVVFGDGRKDTAVEIAKYVYSIGYSGVGIDDDQGDYFCYFRPDKSKRGFEYNIANGSTKEKLDMHDSKLNLRNTLNEIDKSIENPCFVNLYDAADLSEDDKLKLANILVSDDGDLYSIYDFLMSKCKIDECADDDTFITEAVHKSSLDTIVKNFGVVAPAYRGAHYPDFNPYCINEHDIPDNMRYKDYDLTVEGDKLKLKWMTQEDFDITDGNAFIREAMRALKYVALKTGYDKPFVVNLDVYCRDGRQYGNINKDITIEPVKPNENREQLIEDVWNSLYEYEIYTFNDNYTINITHRSSNYIDFYEYPNGKEEIEYTKDEFIAKILSKLTDEQLKDLVDLGDEE